VLFIKSFRDTSSRLLYIQAASTKPVDEPASWYTSRAVRTWSREHNRQVKCASKGVRILPLFLPKQNPWLNPIEPHWVHGKRAVVEPNGLLTARQLAERICAYYHCPYETHLSLPEKVS
jgi:hypothetical protein